MKYPVSCMSLLHYFFVHLLISSWAFLYSKWAQNKFNQIKECRKQWHSHEKSKRSPNFTNKTLPIICKIFFYISNKFILDWHFNKGHFIIVKFFFFTIASPSIVNFFTGPQNSWAVDNIFLLTDMILWKYSKSFWFLLVLDMKW